MKLALLAGFAATGSTLATAAPRCDHWVTYQGFTFSVRVQPTERGFLRDVGDGGVPRFRVRFAPTGGERGCCNPARSDGVGVRIEPETQDARSASGDAALLPDLARLDLEPAAATPWFENYRTNEAWRWRAERIRQGARYERLELALDPGILSPAAELCRRVRVEPLEGVTSDTCTFEAIRDQNDGWPIAARLTRDVRAARGARESASITFERLEGSQAEPRTVQRR
jgi:hypothetical protein